MSQAVAVSSSLPRRANRKTPAKFSAIADGSTRRRVEDAIERLIDLLDQLDGDPDLEDGGEREMVVDHRDPKPVYGVDQTLGFKRRSVFGDVRLIAPNWSGA